MPLAGRTIAALAALLPPVAMAGAGCGSGADVVGTMRVAGSSTLQPLVQRAAVEFSNRHPLARIVVGLSGTTEGITLLCDGLTGAAAASRPLTPRESRACAVSGVDAVPLLVGRDAIVVFSARGSRVPQCLSTRELALVAGGSPAARLTWRGIGPRDLPMRLVVPEAGSGTRDAFERRVLGDPGTTAIALRRDAIAAPQGPQMLSRVLTIRGAIGVAGYTTVEPWLDRVRAIAVNGGDGCVTPSEASIASGRYPLARDLTMVVRANGVGADGETARAFGDVVASPAMLGRPGSGLSPADIRATAREWSTRRAGGGTR